MRFHAVIHRLRALVTLIFIGGFGLAFIAPTVQAAPGSSDPAWQAAYWNNVNLTGRPVLQRSESDLNYDWGAGSPDPSVRADRFGARWTRYVYFDAGTYRFDATSDDGVRVYVDNVRLINAWYDHAAQTFSGTRTLAAGRHLITVYYYEDTGPASVRVAWSQVSGGGGGSSSGGNTNTPGGQWRAEYYNNRDLTGAPAVVRNDAQINFDWGTGAPASGVNSDNFSARWTRLLSLGAGTYRFQLTVDDGARLWVNNQLLIDAWRVQGPTTFTGDITLFGNGASPLRLEYFDSTGGASVRLSWTLLNSSTPAPPSSNWRGEYYNNPSLTGAPVLVRNDNSVDFDWYGGSPQPGLVNVDNFSARWTRSLDLAAGNYRFSITVDDGARLWVNNQLIIDAWRDEAVTSYAGTISLPGGPVPVRLEYYERSNVASIHLAWALTDNTSNNSGGSGGTIDNSDYQPDPVDDWRGEYFNNRDLSGDPVRVRHDDDINFNWGNDSPASRVNADNFSVRWTNKVDFPHSGNYRFETETDDGVRLYVDDKLVIDQWHTMDRKRYHYDAQISKGEHKVRMEYFDAGGSAFARLRMTALDLPEYVGNLITCVPPQPANYAWIKIYRLDGNGNWYSISKGIGSIQASGFLKIDGLPVDIYRFSSAGEPYRIEQWINGKVVQSVGNTAAGQPQFLLRPAADNYTPWQCK